MFELCEIAVYIALEEIDQVSPTVGVVNFHNCNLIQSVVCRKTRVADDGMKNTGRH